jgi:Uma2 family endonuclease
MPQTLQEIEPLVAGDNLTWEEFEKRWDAMPELKRAELIGGVVYIMSPTSTPHATHDIDACGSLWFYSSNTPGTQCAAAATWRMLDDAPQPDASLRIVEGCGGKSHVNGKYVEGAPELVIEVCHSSAAYDLHQKKDLYYRAGVAEYVALLLREHEARWHRWTRDGYEVLPIPPDGILRSEPFPGLWLNVPALLEGNGAAQLATLQQGIQSPEHAAFVKTLASRKERR